MNKERYKFPLFDIVDVPFEVEGKIYCYSKFDIIFIDGCPRTLDREMIGDIPDNINKIVLEYVTNLQFTITTSLTVLDVIKLGTKILPYKTFGTGY